MDLAKLREPFSAKDIEWRVQRSGVKNGSPWAMVLAYVTNRAIMERLDEVCGPEGWKNCFEKAPDGGILCGLSIKCGEEWVTKYDGAANTDVESVKGGLSSAMKRAGSQWGIGRYLYNLDTGFATISAKGKFSAKAKDENKKDVWFKWDAPNLPPWALPAGESVAEKKNVANAAKGKQSLDQGNIDGWVAVGVAAIMKDSTPAEWWAKFKERVIADCGVEGAKVVHKKVVK
jgi:hypothetical protein